MDKAEKRLKSRQNRHARLRKKVFGTDLRPRLSVFRSAMHIYVQAVDDSKGRTIAASSSVEIKEALKKIYSGNKDSAKAVGIDVAKKLLEKSITSVVFDRGGFVYHGRVKALADAAREAGLKF